MIEEGVQMNEEAKPVQESTPKIQDESVDYKALYLDEVQNAKKLRKRAQDAEVTIQENMKRQETLKVKRMQEQEKYKELYESVAPFKDKWESYESARKEALLSKLPEEDREDLNQKDLETLEYIVRLKEESKPVNPAHNPGMPRSIPLEFNKPYSEMSEQEKRAYYTHKANEQANRN
tara:strand:- start:4001 stop:4531 length:531 start_codon:yes stop_codon:yes gene_type:complete